MNITLAKQLEERLSRNRADFKACIMAQDKRLVFELADAIAAVEQSYYHLTTQTDFDDEDAEFLLKFRYPLLIIAEMWASHLDEQSVDFDEVLYEFYDDENLGEYPLASDSNMGGAQKCQCRS